MLAKSVHAASGARRWSTTYDRARCVDSRERCNSTLPIGLMLSHLLAQRLGIHPEIARNRPLALKRQPDPALNQLSGYFFGLATGREHPFLPGHDPGFKVSVNPETAQPKR